MVYHWCPILNVFLACVPFLHGTVFKLTTNKKGIDTFAKKQFEMHPVFKPQMKRGGGSTFWKNTLKKEKVTDRLILTECFMAHPHHK